RASSITAARCSDTQDSSWPTGRCIPARRASRRRSPSRRWPSGRPSCCSERAERCLTGAARVSRVPATVGRAQAGIARVADAGATGASTVDARALARRSRPDLDALFATLPAPAPDEVVGELRGTTIDVAGADRLPPRLRAALLAVLRAPAGPWRGKR